MNRRTYAVIVLVVAIPLFGAGLVSPVPDYDAHLELDATAVENTTGVQAESVMQYRNLTVPAQRLFDRVQRGNGSNETLQNRYPPIYGATKNDSDDVILPQATVPEDWTSLVPDSKGMDITSVYLSVGEQDYHVRVSRATPKLSTTAVLLRLGPLLGAIGLGTLASYLVLSADD